jgi:hypothetical protein
MNKQIAQVAAKWWADHLRHGSSMDNGDDSETGAMTMIMATLLNRESLAKRKPQDADNFETALVDVLTEKETRHTFCMGVDYDPDYTLCQAADKAGIKLGMGDMPWKTLMWIDTNTIKVAEGYRAAPVVIYTDGEAPHE